MRDDTKTDSLIYSPLTCPTCTKWKHGATKWEHGVGKWEHGVNKWKHGINKWKHGVKEQVENKGQNNPSATLPYDQSGHPLPPHFG